MTKAITVFTPTYNRANTLVRTYQSLCRQTCKDFEWLIIDDGSSDGTEIVVKKWQEEDIIPIRYIYQENRGYCEARETAYRNIDSELNVCIDSDDWMPDDAVEKILKLWKEKGSNKYAGILGLDAYEDGTIVGTVPDGISETTMREYSEIYKGVGDRKQVYRTDVIKRYPPTPSFKGERFLHAAYKYYLIDEDYPLLVSNDVFTYVEYQVDGLSANELKNRWNNPRSAACTFLLSLRQTKSITLAVRYCLHYIACSIRARNVHFISESPRKALTIFLLPEGFALYLYYYYKAKLFFKPKSVARDSKTRSS